MSESADRGAGAQEGEHPDYGERPESPETGHPVKETEPVEGVDEGMHEHPEDIKPPGGSERDEGPTTSPGQPPDPEGG
jgi:hypothetical protein